MIKKTIEIRNIYEDEIEFFIDGVKFGSVNHDDDGWSGMSKAQTIVESLAKALNLEIIETNV